MIRSNPTLSMDAWTASSLLQKAIRRGEDEYAAAAAIALFHMRGQHIWKRLTLIAFEDIGLANTEVCIEVTSLAQDQSLRRHSPEVGAITSIVKKMSDAAKNREADYLICSAKQGAVAESIRSDVGKRSVAERIQMAGCEDLPLLTRSVAAWMASGINGGGPAILSDGDLAGLLHHFVELGLEREFASSVVAATRLSKEPIVLLTALLSLSIWQQGVQTSIVEETAPPSVLCNGIPSWVFDKHTRIGKLAIRQLLRENRNVRERIGDFVPEFRALDVAAMSAFYADAVAMRHRCKWEQSDVLFELGVRTDMTKIGTPNVGVVPIVSILRENLDHLNDIRRRIRESQATSLRAHG